jgi:hypothetical protein
MVARRPIQRAKRDSRTWPLRVRGALPTSPLGHLRSRTAFPDNAPRLQISSSGLRPRRLPTTCAPRHRRVKIFLITRARPLPLAICRRAKRRRLSTVSGTRAANRPRPNAGRAHHRGRREKPSGLVLEGRRSGEVRWVPLGPRQRLRDFKLRHGRLTSRLVADAES